MYQLVTWSLAVLDADNSSYPVNNSVDEIAIYPRRLHLDVYHMTMAATFIG